MAGEPTSGRWSRWKSCLRFNPENELSLWQKMKMVKSIEQAIKQTTAVNATLSVATFEPYMPPDRDSVDEFERKTKVEKWTDEFDQFVKTPTSSASWGTSPTGESASESRHSMTSTTAIFSKRCGNNVDHQMEHLDQHGVDAYLTGGIPLVYKAQHQILSDLMYSFLTAFVIITVILIIVLRSVRAGLVAMIPNVFPPLVVFGAMGWLGYSIEIGSVMTASVALGIAVDDTLHFLTWYRRGTKEGLSRFSSIRFAFRTLCQSDDRHLTDLRTGRAALCVWRIHADRQICVVVDDHAVYGFARRFDFAASDSRRSRRKIIPLDIDQETNRHG